MIYELPTTVEMCGTTYQIRSDYRAALDILSALNDPELSGQEKAFAALDILYPDFERMPPEHYQAALGRCTWFLDCGEAAPERRTPKLMDWEADFKYIVAPINRVIGVEIRTVNYLHWWSFISAYYEIGDCLFAQIVRIRDRKAHGKPLDKQDQEWYRKNRHLVDLKQKYTAQDDAVFDRWTGKGNSKN